MGAFKKEYLPQYSYDDYKLWGDYIAQSTLSLP